ncbi:MAG: ATP-dependent zinc protease [Mangrovibacterium sp.]
MNKLKLTIGRREIVDFPKLQLEDIEVKIDTGAYTSSIHCHEVNEVEQNGEMQLCCQFLDPTHLEYNEKELYFSNYSIKKVRSSNGIVESRYKVKTSILLFGKEYPIHLTLTERSKMKYSVLIGRRFLQGKFVVDTELLHVSSLISKV